jgi:hypothetical protein
MFFLVEFPGVDWRHWPYCTTKESAFAKAKESGRNDWIIHEYRGIKCVSYKDGTTLNVELESGCICVVAHKHYPCGKIEEIIPVIEETVT